MSLIFALSGATQASWLSRLPTILERTHTGFVGLGIALLLLGVGTLAAMLSTGSVCERYGSRRVLAVGLVVGAASLVAIALSRSLPHLALSLLVMGVGSGVWDAGMNVQGYAVEAGLGRHLMSRFHGWWSIGSMVGAGLGVVATRFSVPLLGHLTAVAVISAASFLVCARSLVADEAPQPDAARSPARRPVRRLVAIGVLMFSGATVEGAAGDWLAVYLNQERRLSHTGATLGYALFLSAMAAGRLAAERPHRSVGVAGVVRGGSILAGAGIGLVVLARTSGWIFVGALCWGVGICWGFPAALSATGNIATPSAVAFMTAVGYSASIVGPLAVGWLAHTVGLGVAILSLLPLALLVALLAPVLTGASREPAE
ncbi:MFS transporter [Actinoplanes sp. NPDC051411]|uniref:MFS transporter n=1 Tax=Actinoplanes sp. NPDC051411 TaxID=3155522 RepID=UPI003431F28C